MTKKQPMSEELDAIDDELLTAIANVKGHAVQKAKPQPVSAIYPLSSKSIAWLKAEEVFLREKEAREKPLKEALKDAVSGQRMPDGSIYLGKYSPRDRKGISLRQEFNVLVAGEDLPGGIRTYNETVQHMAQLRNWNGYDGARYKNDAEFFEALRDGVYDGRWIIPTMEILSGQNADDNYRAITADNIATRRASGAFEGTFSTIRSDFRAGAYHEFYWSSTDVQAHGDEYVYIVNINGNGSWTQPGKDDGRANCRPVRLVPCP